MSQLRTLTNTDPDFYPTLGPWLARREVHRRLGGTPWDEDEKTWVVAIDDDGRVEGFIGVTTGRMKGVAVAESGFVVDLDSEADLMPVLVRAAVATVAPTPVRTTVRSHLERIYTRAGFTVASTTNGFIKLAHGGGRKATRKKAAAK